MTNKQFNIGIAAVTLIALLCAFLLTGFSDSYQAAREEEDATSVLIDPLVVTLSTDEEAFTTFADTVRQIKEIDPDVHITSGLSNISFGLPKRRIINQAFMILAAQAGMDSAIMDRSSERRCSILKTYSAG